MIKNQIELTVAQRDELERYCRTGTHSSRSIKHANVVLLLDTSEGRTAMGWKEIAEQQGICEQTIWNIRRSFQASDSISAFLERKKRLTPPVESKITGEVEARIIALACSKPPEGCARWTLRLLANKTVELSILDSISHNAIKVILKNTT